MYTLENQNCKKEMITNRINRVLPISLLVIFMTGCKTEPITTVSFYPAGGTYENGQIVDVELPANATNVYLTTDTLDPVANPLCAYAGENLTINRSTQIKLTYDVAGVTYHADQLYVIEGNTHDHGYANRNVISSWESFFVKGVLRRFDVPSDADSTLAIQDGDGGSVTLQTSIFDRTTLGTPTSGEQTYSFDFYEYTDPDTSETIMLQAGSIYGFKDEDGGFYTTLPRNGRSGGGSRLAFAGAYTGWADGDFIMDAEGRTTSGSYTVFCSDAKCAPIPITYALGTHNQLIEVEPTHDEFTHSCLSAMPE